MIITINRRLRRLELASGRGHPWHIPFRCWSEQQITALIAPGRRPLTDDEIEPAVERFVGTASDDVLMFMVGDDDAEASTLEARPSPSRRDPHAVL